MRGIDGGSRRGLARVRIGDATRTLADRSRLLAVVVVGLGIVVAIALVLELASPMRLGSHFDFLAFYGAGHLVRAGDPNGIYDAATLAAVQRTVVPHAVGANDYMPFINPPFAAVAFAPLAGLPAESARAAWAALSVVLLVASAAAVARSVCPRRATGGRALLPILVVALSFPAYHALAEGQWSILLLASGLAAVAAAREGRWGLAGLALAAFWLKPQLLALPLVALAAARQWRALAGAALGGVVLVALGLPFTGTAPYERYVGYLAEVATSHFSGAGASHATVWQGALATTEGLNGLLVGYLGQASEGPVTLLWLVASGALIALYAVAIGHQRPGFATLGGRAMIAAGILVSLLVNPNLFAQDCLLVFVALAALGPLPRRLALPAIVATAAAGYLIVLDLVGLPVHLFTIVLAGLVVGTCLFFIRRRRPVASGPGERDRGRAAAGWSSS